MRVQESGVAGSNWQGTVVPGYFPTYCLQQVKPQAVTATMPDGKALEFEPVLTPQCQPFVPIQESTVSFRPRPGTQATLAPAGDGFVWVEGGWPGLMQLFDGVDFSVYDPNRYRLTLPDGRVFEIEQGSGLKKVTDTNGNTLTITPAGITHSSGKGVAFVRDGQGRITTITDPAGNPMTYGYDANGDLGSFTDREASTTTFTYEAAFPHHLKAIQDPLGRSPIRNNYDDSGRLVSHVDAYGKTMEYTHSLGTRQEIVQDRNGKQRVLEYDQRGNVVRETDPKGKVVLRSFDGRNNRLSETEPHDPPTTPNPPTTSYVYDTADNLLSVTDSETHTTEYTYNARKQVLTSKDPKRRQSGHSPRPFSQSRWPLPVSGSSCSSDSSRLTFSGLVQRSRHS